MEILKIEYQAFIDENANPSHSDIMTLISLFSKYELMPQFIQENIENSKETRKVMTLVNQIKGLSIAFYSKRLVISQDFNTPTPIEAGQPFIDFTEFSHYCIAELNKAYYQNKLFNRLSLVTTLLKKIPSKDKEKICKNIMGNDEFFRENIIELKVRYAFRENATSLGEPLNIATMINDGIFEKTNAQNNQFERTDCFLVQVDTNTLAEITKNRFQLPNTHEVLEEFKQKTMFQLQQILKKF